MNVIISNKHDEVLSNLQIDVIKKIQGEYSVNELVSMFDNFYYQKMIIDLTSIKGYEDIKNLQSLSIYFDVDKLILFLDDTLTSEYISKLISMGIYNFTKNTDGIMKLINEPNTYKDVASLHNLEDKVTVMTRVENSRTKILGIENSTEHAGSTTLIYLLLKLLSENYTVKAIEINKRDFTYFNDKNLISTTIEDLGKEMLKLNGSVDIVLIDLNHTNQDKACNDIIYLLEPSIIRLNKLIAKNKELLSKIKNKKVILNKCLLSQKDIEKFEMESGIRVFYKIPPINDRGDVSVLNEFLVKLGFLKQRVNEENVQRKNKLFDIFKHKS